MLSESRPLKWIQFLWLFPHSLTNRSAEESPSEVSTAEYKAIRTPSAEECMTLCFQEMRQSNPNSGAEPLKRSAGSNRRKGPRYAEVNTNLNLELSKGWATRSRPQLSWNIEMIRLTQRTKEIPRGKADRTILTWEIEEYGVQQCSWQTPRTSTAIGEWHWIFVLSCSPYCLDRLD